MTYRSKYQPVIDLAQQYNMRTESIEEKDNQLQMKGTVETQYQKDRLWDKIKAIGGENPRDIMADIKVSNTSYYTKHTVEKGESLSKIAKAYYGDPMQYNRIFQANTDQLKDPNMIYPGQELTIPYPEGRKPGA